MIKPKPIFPRYKSTLFLLAGIMFACLPHAAFQPLCVIVVCVLCLSWRVGVLLEWLPAPPKFVQALIAAVSLWMIMHGQHYDLGKEAGISLLITALTIKQIQRHDELNFYFSICLVYFVAAAVFLYDHSFFTFFCVGHAVVFSCLALSASASRADGKLRDDMPFNYGAVARPLFYAIPLTLVLFFLVPDFKGPIWDLPDDAYKAQTGLSSEMSPGKISSLADSNEVVFRVKFKKMPENIPAFIESLYWRGPVFTYFDGQTWQPAGDGLVSPGLHKTPISDTDESAGGFSQAAPVPVFARRKSVDTEYQVTLEPQYNQTLFTLSTPTQVQPGFYVTSENELLSKTIVSHPLQYTLKVDITDAMNRLAPVKSRYLNLPNMYGRKTKALVKRIKQDLDPNLPFDVQFVTKVLDYIRKNPFYYSRNPPLLKYDPIDEFVLNTRTGFCEHFASAFAFMMRAAHIPARVVTGYQGGEYNPVGGYIIVRQSDAHAWTEVWLQNYGWVKVDPTAVIPASRIEVNDTRTAAYLLAGFMVWDNGALRSLGNWMDNLSFHWYSLLAQVLQAKLDSHGLGWLLQSKSFLLWTLLLLFVSLLATRRLQLVGISRDPVLQAYGNFCGKLTRLGLARFPHESASGYALRVCEARPDLEAGVKTIAALYNQLRYGKSASQTTFQQFCREIAGFRP